MYMCSFTASDSCCCCRTVGRTARDELTNVISDVVRVVTMLSLTRDLLRKTQDKSLQEIKPLTVCFWSDFAANPAVMYDLFSPNPRQLDYNPEKVKVMGTADGMIKLV